MFFVSIHQKERVKHNEFNRRSYMSAHVLLNFLNELEKRDKMRGLSSNYLFFRNEFNKFILSEHECYSAYKKSVNIAFLRLFLYVPTNRRINIRI